MARFRFYLNGRLSESKKVTPEIGAKWLANYAAEWRRNQVTPEHAAEIQARGLAENNAVTVELTDTTLDIVTTEGNRLHWEVK